MAGFQDIAQQRAMAQMLMQQGMTPEQGQMVSGHYVAPAFGGMGRLANIWAGKNMLNDANQAETTNRTNDVQALISALQGKLENAPADGMGPTMPAQAGSPQAAMAVALQSRDPMVQGIGAKLLEGQMKAPSWKLGERYNQQTGMPEKIMYNENDPSQIMPMGGQQAIKNEAVNLGGTTQFVNPYAQSAPLAHTQTPDSAASIAAQAEQGGLNRGVTIRGQDLTNSSSQTGHYLTQRGQDLTDARARETLAQNGNKPTEVQGKAALFGARAKESDAILTNLEGKYSRMGLNAKTGAEGTWGIGGVLGAVGNAALSKESQQVEQAQRDFVNATLRQESGAVISPSEFDNAKKQYFPQPGDSDEVVAQKARNRQTAIMGFNNMAGGHAYDAPEIKPDHVQSLLDKYK